MILAEKLKRPVPRWVPFTNEGIQSLLPCRHSSTLVAGMGPRQAIATSDDVRVSREDMLSREIGAC